MPDDFERMWADLAPVGRSAASGGYFRQPYLSAETELRAWFLAQAQARGLRVESDPVGNVVAWWAPPGVTGPGVLTGSHLDSVLEGGAYDGPLGVVSALAAVDVLRVARVRAGEADRGVGLRRGGGVAVRARLPGLPARCGGGGLAGRAGAARPGRRLVRGRAVGAPASAPRRTSRGTWPRPSRASSSCTSSRGATWSTGVRPSGWRARSGRTGATASTSPGPRTTPGPPGWRTGRTRC